MSNGQIALIYIMTGYATWELSGALNDSGGFEYTPRSFAVSAAKAILWPLTLSVFLLRVMVSIPLALYSNEWKLVPLVPPTPSSVRPVEKPVDPESERIAEAMREVEEMLK